MTSFALKEWDAQCQLLQRGEYSLIIRKGGIRELRGGFEVKHDRFLLYPTFVHENPQELRPPHHELLRPDPQPGQVQCSAQAEVVAVYKIESLEEARALEPLQALTAQAIERKFNYRNRPWVHALLLRIQPLTRPLHFPETPKMRGCVSWVPLDDPQYEVARPVVSEAELERRRLELEHRLT